MLKSYLVWKLSVDGAVYMFYQCLFSGLLFTDKCLSG